MSEFNDFIKLFESSEEDTIQDDAKTPIILIDDDESIRRGFSRAFSHKYDITTAESGRRGLEILSDEFHCIILDVKMRDLDGFSTYSKLKEKCPEIPIIFYTAFQSEHDLQEIINKYKPEGYVEKGRDISFLENLIENAINKYKLVLENEAYKGELEEKVENKTKELMQIQDEKHLLELDLTIGDQIFNIMYSDLPLLINSVSTYFNATENVINAWEDYQKAIKKEIDVEAAFENLDCELEKMAKTGELGHSLIDDYRNYTRALLELRGSDNRIRNPNRDLKYLQSLINNKFGFIDADLELELSNDIPDIYVTGRAQSSFLEIAINSVKNNNTKKLLGKTELVKASELNGFTHDMVGIHIYTDGTSIDDDSAPFKKDLFAVASSRTDLYRTKARIERNGGVIRLEEVDLPDYNNHFAIYLPVQRIV